MATMDLSPTRKGPGISVFWMIIAVAIGTGIVLAIALSFTEGSSTPTTGTTDATTEAVGPAPEGLAGTTDEGMMEPAAEDAVQNSAGTNLGGDVQGNVARTDDAPNLGVTDTEPRVQEDGAAAVATETE